MLRLLTVDQQSPAADPDLRTRVVLRVQGEDAGWADDHVVDVAAARPDRHRMHHGPSVAERFESAGDLEFAERADVPGVRVLRQRRPAEEPCEGGTRRHLTLNAQALGYDGCRGGPSERCGDRGESEGS
jgi:hypothetical protein